MSRDYDEAHNPKYFKVVKGARININEARLEAAQERINAYHWQPATDKQQFTHVRQVKEYFNLPFTTEQVGDDGMPTVCVTQEFKDQADYDAEISSATSNLLRNNTLGLSGSLPEMVEALLKIASGQQVGEVQGDAHSLISNWRSESVGREDETGYVRGSMFTFAKCADELESRLTKPHSKTEGQLGAVPLDQLANLILDQHCPAGSYERSDVLDAITAALSARQPVEFERAVPTHRRESAVELLLKLGFVWNDQRWEDRRPPAQGIDLGHARVIEMLLTLAETAYNLADNANDMAECENVDYTDFVALSDALDALDQLPDDQPGYTMSEPAKARWALRALIGQRNAAPGMSQ